MSRLLAPVAVLLVAGGLSAQPAKKLPPPRVVEEKGGKVAVFEYGKTDPAVRVGELVFRILPLSFESNGKESGSPNVGYDVENRSGNPVTVTNQTVNWSTAEAEAKAADDTGRVVAFTKTASPPGDWELPPNRAKRFTFPMTPQLDPRAKGFTVEVVAPPTADPPRWRIIFPRDTWLSKRPDLVQPLPNTKG